MYFSHRVLQTARHGLCRKANECVFSTLSFKYFLGGMIKTGVNFRVIGTLGLVYNVNVFLIAIGILHGYCSDF